MNYNGGDWNLIVGSDGKVWMKHGWNSYNGVHFDLMMDMKRDGVKSGIYESMFRDYGMIIKFIIRLVIEN